mmetsp:Transcript_15767/g.21667  ORF Transcript_15767/g.21667 Transcript_15767/m.21667 type:complete len:474 (+) Transcript_15767:60-1481(+)
MYEKCSIFVGNLAIFCTEKDIEAAFSPFGQILSISIKCDEETSKNLSYGFIKFASEISAHQAMKSLNGSLLCGRPLRIGRALKEKSKEKYPVANSKSAVLETSSIHVTYISYQINNLVTEESLRAIFSTFGDVLDASIKKSTVDDVGNCQSGYGFVHYSNSLKGIESAFEAARSLYDVQIDNVNYICKISHALENYLKGNTQRASPSHPEPPPTVPITPPTSLPTFHRPVKQYQPPQQPQQQHALLDRLKKNSVEPNLFPNNYNNNVHAHSNHRPQPQLQQQQQEHQDQFSSTSKPTMNFFADSETHFDRLHAKPITKSGPLLSTRVRKSFYKQLQAPQSVPSRESLIEQESYFRRFGYQAYKHNELVSTSFSSHSSRDITLDDNNNPNRLFSLNSFPLTNSSNSTLETSFPLDQFHHCNLMALDQGAIPLQSPSWPLISPPNQNNNHQNNLYNHHHMNKHNHKFDPQGSQIW